MPARCRWNRFFEEQSTPDLFLTHEDHSKTAGEIVLHKSVFLRLSRIDLWTDLSQWTSSQRPQLSFIVLIGVILCLKTETQADCDVERHALFKTICNNNNVYDDGEVMNNGEVGRTGCQSHRKIMFFNDNVNTTMYDGEAEMGIV